MPSPPVQRITTTSLPVTIRGLAVHLAQIPSMHFFTCVQGDDLGGAGLLPLLWEMDHCKSSAGNVSLRCKRVSHLPQTYTSWQATRKPFVIPGSYLYLHTVLTLVPLSSQPNVLSDLSCRLYVPLHPLNNFISGKDNVLKLYVNDSAWWHTSLTIQT